MSKRHPHLYFILFIGISLFFILGIGWQWSETMHAQETAYLLSSHEVQLPKRRLAVKLKARKQRPAKQTVKGLYLTAYSAGNQRKVKQIIDLINSTELNSVVIDIKDYSGKILYDSNLLWVNEFETEEDRIGNLEQLIEELHQHDIYVIARQTVFQDPILAEQKPEWAIKNKSGGIWRDHKGLAWVDPTEKAVWRYNAAIAKEAALLGFDEINFDYVRFPSDGDMSQVVYTNSDKELFEVMHEFFHFLNQELSSRPVWISIDVFGFAMERDDGMQIGQRLKDAVDEVDYICPMMYPSHYPFGHLGFANPAAYPGAVIENGMKSGLSYFTTSTRAELRPWIQAFNLGAVYGAGKIREQIDMVEKYTDAGWLLWNASNRYSRDGLLLEE